MYILFVDFTHLRISDSLSANCLAQELLRDPSPQRKDALGCELVESLQKNCGPETMRMNWKHWKHIIS